MTASIVARTTSPAATRALAAALAAVARPGDLFLLVGDLGAGKTTFAQGFAAGLGVAEPVTSPTFALLRPYRCGGGEVRTLLHADLYRLDHLHEIADLGLGELLEESAVGLVEWGDVGTPVLGGDVVRVELVPDGDLPDEGAAPDGGIAAGRAPEEVRRVTVSLHGEPAARAGAVSAALAPWTVADRTAC